MGTEDHSGPNNPENEESQPSGSERVQTEQAKIWEQIIEKRKRVERLLDLLRKPSIKVETSSVVLAEEALDEIMALVVLWVLESGDEAAQEAESVIMRFQQFVDSSKDELARLARSTDSDNVSEDNQLDGRLQDQDRATQPSQQPASQEGDFSPRDLSQRLNEISTQVTELSAEMARHHAIESSAVLYGFLSTADNLNSRLDQFLEKIQQAFEAGKISSRQFALFNRLTLSVWRNLQTEVVRLQALAERRGLRPQDLGTSFVAPDQQGLSATTGEKRREPSRRAGVSANQQQGLVVEPKSASERQEGKRRLRLEIEQVYDDLYSVKKPSDDEVQYNKRERILAIAKEPGDGSTNSEVYKRWNLAIKLFDGLGNAVGLEGNNNFFQHLGFNDEYAAWRAIEGKISLSEMRELKATDEEIETSTEALRIIVLGDRVMRNGKAECNYHPALRKFLADRGIAEPENLSSFCQWDYANAGQPQSGDKAENPNYLVLEEFLEKLFPAFAPSSRRLAVDIAISTGLRTKAFIKSCYGYSASPDAQYGGKSVVKHVAPIPYILYYMRKTPWIPVGQRSIALSINFTIDGNIERTDVRDGILMRYNDNIKAAQKLWTWFEKFLTDEPLGEFQKTVELSKWNADLQILPTPWDMLSETAPSALNITADNLVTGIEAWDDYVATIESWGHLKLQEGSGEEQVVDCLRELGDKISAIKGISDKIKGTDYYQRFMDMLCFLYLTGLKKLYEAFSIAERKADWRLRPIFLRKLKEATQKGSLPDELKRYINNTALSGRPLIARLFTAESIAQRDFRGFMRKRFEGGMLDVFDQLTSNKIDQEAKKD